MYMRNTYLVFTLLIILLTGTIYPQKISGVITDFKTAEPLIGANVFVKNRNLGTASNVDGKFSLDLSALERGS